MALSCHSICTREGRVWNGHIHKFPGHSSSRPIHRFPKGISPKADPYIGSQAIPPPRFGLRVLDCGEQGFVNPPPRDEYQNFYRQLHAALAALKRGECHVCQKKVEFIQSGENVVGSCGHKLYKGTLGAFPRHPQADPESGAGGGQE